MTLLTFAGQVTFDDAAPVYAEFALEIDRARLAAILQALLDGQPVTAPIPDLRAGNGDASATVTHRSRPTGPRSFAVATEAGVKEIDKLSISSQEPIEVRDHPGRRIRLEHLDQIADSANKWAAIAARFPWLFPAEQKSVKAPDSMAEIEAMANSVTGGDAAPRPSQLDLDWRTIEAHLDELVSDAGELVRGHQSRIAELLGGSNEGAFRRSRVLPVEARLKRWVEAEWLYSTSSTPDESGDEADESGESARVA